MQPSMKVMTVMATMVAAFTILPMLTAVAAEPLDDGTYTVAVEGATHRLTVADGAPAVAETAGVEWFFAYDDEGRVLDEFTIVVDGVAYEVEVGEGGMTFASPADDTFDRAPQPPAPLAAAPAEVEVEEAEVEEAADAVEDDGHGELVSAVTACFPSGRTARDAGLPNRGTLVSAVAKGDELVFTVAGNEYTLVPAAGADALCATVEDALIVGRAAAEAQDADDEQSRGNGAGRGDEAPGRSGAAPGKAGKGAGG